MKATAREKAIIFAITAGYIDTWKEAYILSRDKAATDIDPGKIDPATVTRWKQREEIQKAVRTAQKILMERDETTAARTRDEVYKEIKPGQTEGSNRTENERNAKIDYYNPENQRRQINKIIQQSQDDPKTQLDAIKAIQQTQRDDRQAAKDNQIQRFYSPLRCHLCPLHQKEEERQRRRESKS